MASEERTNRPSWWEIVKWLVGSGVLIMLITLVVKLILYLLPPRFAVSATHTLDGSNQYEITNHWIEATPVSGVTLTWGLEVIPTYNGKSLGEVLVLVKGKNGQTLARESWKPFTKDAQTLSVELDPYLLASEVDRLAAYQEDEGDYIYPVTNLSIEIIKASNPSEPLYADTLTILNTPWYHFAKASTNFLWEERVSVDIFIEGRNLGGPSEFTAGAEVYEITDMSGRPYAPWPKIGYAIEPIDGVIGHDAEFSIRISLPGDAQSAFRFEFGKCYGVVTYVCKRQNYAEFGDVGWRGSGDIWRFADPGNSLLVCVPTQ
jgi:hypothetical protein